MYFHGLILEKTALTLEGLVPSDAKKFEFKDSGATDTTKPVYTYIQTTNQGMSYW